MKSPTGKPILAVDCDLTVVDSASDWLSYLEYYSGFNRTKIKEGDILPYDLSELFPKVSNPYQYWRELDYEQFTPIECAVEKLQILSQHFDIVFISQAKGVHAKSKYYWLEKWFPFNCGVLLTKEKWVVNNSVIGMIDDRQSNLKPFDKDKRILYNSPYKQDEECEVGYVIEDWNSLDVEEFVKYLKGE